MTKKYYRVLQDTFIWGKGAILKLDPGAGNKGGYRAIEDVWDVAAVGNEYILSPIIEHPDNAQFLERVYPDTVSGKLFRTKDQLVVLYQ